VFMYSYVVPAMSMPLVNLHLDRREVCPPKPQCFRPRIPPERTKGHICASDMQPVGFSHVTGDRIPSIAPCVLELYVIKQFDA